MKCILALFVERLGQIGFIQIPNSLTDYKCLIKIIH